MGRHDWYRLTTWSEKDQKAFFARLDRSRENRHKAQYLRIQAVYLEEVGNEDMIKASLSLLDLLFDKYPEPAEFAQAHLQKAHCLFKLGKIDECIDHLHKSLQAEREYPHSKTMAWLDFGWIIVEKKKSNLFDEAIAVLEEFKKPLLFPMEIYKLNAILALIAEECGEFVRAREYARTAIEASSRKDSGLRYHRDAGLVKNTNTSVHARLDALVATSG